MFLQRFSPKFLARKLGRVPARVRGILSEYRFFTYIFFLGPGLVAAASGNEASGIATYSSAGAEYGYSLLWAFVPMTIAFIIAQEMCIRMGIVTGQGLADLIREQFGVRWTSVVVIALLIANLGIVIAEFVGIAQASELFGVSRYISVPAAAFAMWWIVVRGTAKGIEKFFLLMSLVFVTYIFAAFLAKPHWPEVVREFATPSFRFETRYMFTVVALIGTTITPFMQMFVQSSVLEKGYNEEDLGLARADAIIGVIFANIIAAFVVISTAATLHSKGILLNDASDAARALAPVVGPYAEILFAIGLFGASMLAMGVVPLATAYSVSEALGFEKGLSRSFREAPIFLGIFTSLILVGSISAMIPGIPQIKLLIVTQFINGLLLPIVLIAIVKLASNPEIMGRHRNAPLFNFFAWMVAVAISALSLMLIGKTIADMF